MLGPGTPSGAGEQRVVVAGSTLDTIRRSREQAIAPLLSLLGELKVRAFGRPDGRCDLALTSREPHRKPSPLLRVQSHCLFGPTFLAADCDCRDQVHTALALLREHGGVMIYLDDEARGHGLKAKVEIAAAQTKGATRRQAQHRAGYEADVRDYRRVPEILRALGIPGPFILLTDDGTKVDRLKSVGVDIADVAPLLGPHSPAARALIQRWWDPKVPMPGLAAEVLDQRHVTHAAAFELDGRCVVVHADRPDVVAWANYALLPYLTTRSQTQGRADIYLMSCTAGPPHPFDDVATWDEAPLFLGRDGRGCRRGNRRVVVEPVSGDWGLCDSGTGEVLLVTCHDDPFSLRQPARLIREALFRMQEAGGWLRLHCGAAVADGVGVLLLGPKRSGKTTLLIHVLGEDISLVANDRACLSLADGGVAHVVGIPVFGRVGVEAARCHHRLADHVRDLEHFFHDASRADSVGSKLELSPRELARLTDSELSPRARVGLVVVPCFDPDCDRLEVTETAPSRRPRVLTRSLLTPDPAFPDWLELAPTEPEAGTRRGATAQSTCRLPWWEVRFGPRTVQSAAQQVRDLLAEAKMS